MISFRDLSINAKLTGIISLVSMFVVGIGFVVVAVQSASQLRDQLHRQGLINARLVGEYAVGPLAFGDKAGGNEILERLATIPMVTNARLFDQNDHLFSSYDRAELKDPLRAHPQSEGAHFESDWLHIYQPIEYKGESYGSIYLRISTSDLDQQIFFHLSLLSGLFLLLLFLSVMLARRLGNVIAKPIATLADAASVAAEREDYSVRVPKMGQDELGLLTDGFNTMLGRIEQQQADRDQVEEELKRHQNNLEELVEVRTVELGSKNLELSQSQEALISLLEDVNETRVELDEANQKLKELDNLKSMFIASMSHELRTPLNAIIGFTGIMLQGMSGEINLEQKDQLKRVYGSGKHLLELITEIIDISKIEAGKLEPYPLTFLLDGVIEEAVSGLKNQIKEKGLGIETEIPPYLQLRNDRTRLLQCLLNYLSNAMKFTERGKISIIAREVGNMLEISVKDTGVGIKEADIPKLFAPFTRVDTSLKPAALGTGLGLYLTKKLADEVLGGSVAVESEIGKGSTFILKIPINT